MNMGGYSSDVRAYDLTLHVYWNMELSRRLACLNTRLFTE